MLKSIIFLFALTSVSGSLKAQDAAVPLSARYAERELASYYESLANSAISQLIPPEKYKLLVDVKIESDAEKDLQKIQTEMQTTHLPGTLSKNPDISKDVLLGKFESLAQKRNVLLIIDPEYEKAFPQANLKELLQETITGRLKLNIASGQDAINIRNLGITSSARGPASSEPAQLLSSSDWLGSFLWMSGLILVLGATWALYRRFKAKNIADKTELTGSLGAASGDPKKSSEKESVIKNVPEEVSLEELFDADGNKIEKAVEDKKLAPKDYDPSTLLILPTSANAQELVDRVNQLVGQYPKLTAEALQKFMDTNPDKLFRVAYLIELIGFEESLKMFKGVSQKHWRLVGTYMAANPVSNNNPIDLEEAAILYRYLVASIVEHKGLESDMGVFAIEGFSANDLAKAIETEDDRFIAQFISGISDVMAQDILNSLPVSRRVNVLTLLSSIDKLDPEHINSIETTIKSHLSSQKARSVSISNESRIFLSLTNLNPHEEESIFSQMLMSDPGIGIRARRFRLYPEHLESIRKEILEEELRTYPIEQIALMLKGMQSRVRDHMLSAMPEKKGMVVRDMLSTLASQPAGPEVSQARRDFLNMIYEKYTKGGPSFIDSIFRADESMNMVA